LSLEKDDPKNDISWVWRNTLEDNEQTRHVSGIKEHLLVFLRDLSITLIKDNNSLFEVIIKKLNESGWTIFKRLAIFLSVKFPDIDLELTQQLICQTDLYESPRTRNEYSLLLDAAFSIVGQQAQNAVYTWIEAGIDLENYTNRYKSHEGATSCEEEFKEFNAYWKTTRLHLIRNHLKGEKLAEYRALVKDKGKPEHPEYSSYTTSWVGPTSPITVDEINELDIKELVQELKAWKAGGKSMDSSPEGLSRNLSEAIKTNIDKYKHSASMFKGLPATYIRGLFQGFRDNLTNLDHHSWSEIIDLSEWVLSQENDVEVERDIDSGEDPSWSWCRKTMANLLNEGFKKGEGQIPITLKDNVWSLVKVLTEDPDPTPEYEAEYGGSNMTPSDLAINTVRGEAMHALVQYGLWFKRNSSENNVSFKDIPEVQKVLDEHLDPEKDQSKAIRSVYGQYYPWLIILDKNWSDEAKKNIFSDDALGLGDAAWGAYITFCGPYDDTLKVIPDIYLKHVERIADVDESDDEEQTQEHLAAHLITFYWRSKLELTESIFQMFYKRAPLKLRKYVIEFIGRSLGNTPEGLEENIKNRLKALYEWRQSEVNKTNEYEELEGFCWWVDADVFDKKWSLTKFHELLKVQGSIDSLDFAARKLDGYLDIDPEKVLVCLDLMIDKLKIQGMYFTWDDYAQEILISALRMSEVKEQAIELVNKFGSLGFLKYRELLSNN
jgi:hypothetical protein